MGGMALLVPAGNAAEITIKDWTGPSSQPIVGPAWGWEGGPAGPVGEDNETEAVTGGVATLRGQTWDLEAITFRKVGGVPMLYLVGGYDFFGTATSSIYGSDTRYAGGTPGDLFIKIFDTVGGSAPHWNPTVTSLSYIQNGVANVPNYAIPYEFDFAVRISASSGGASGNLSVVDLNGNTWIRSVVNDSLGSNPWRLANSGEKTQLNDGTSLTPFTYATGLSTADVNTLTGESLTLLADDNIVGVQNPTVASTQKVYTHNVLAIDLSFLTGQSLSSDTVWFNFTQECGNDMIHGAMAGGFRTPDGGLTVLLLGFGLSGLALANRKLRAS